MTFGLYDGSKNLDNCFRLTWTLCFERIRLNQLRSKILFHDRVPVIVSWFASVIEGLCVPPLSNHQSFLHGVELRQCVFCKETLSFWLATRLHNFGLLGEVNMKTMHPGFWYNFRWTFRIWVLGNVCVCRHFCLFQNICELLQPFMKISNIHHILDCHFLKILESYPHQLPEAGPSLRSWAGVVEDNSCTVDVEDGIVG